MESWIWTHNGQTRSSFLPSSPIWKMRWSFSRDAKSSGCKYFTNIILFWFILQKAFVWVSLTWNFLERLIFFYILDPWSLPTRRRRKVRSIGRKLKFPFFTVMSSWQMIIIRFFCTLNHWKTNTFHTPICVLIFLCHKEIHRMLYNHKILK